MNCIQKIKLISLIIGVLITGSFQHITIPLFVEMFPSLYFLLVLTAVEGLILYTLLLTFILIRNGGSLCGLTQKDLSFTRDLSWDTPCGLTQKDLPFTRDLSRDTFWIPPNTGFIIITIGVTNAIMSICFIYAANPIRTPVVIQSIFLGLAIIPSVLFTKFILKKDNYYNFKYAVPSMICLLLSIVLAVLPLLQKTVIPTFWILMYMFGVIFMSLTNILQEKYVSMTDGSFENKIKLALFSGLVQIITIFGLFWVDIFFGYSHTLRDAANAFIASILGFQGNLTGTLLIQLFVLDCLILFIISIYLNEISTNYNMILTNLTNQSVALFFTIFPDLNHGAQYPLSITMLSMLCNIISIILWVKAEEAPISKETPSYGTF